MNQHILNELVYGLRRVEGFPAGAAEALNQFQQIYFTFKSSNLPWNSEALTELVVQFVFGIYDTRDITRSRLSTGEKLECAELILAYLSHIELDSDRQVIFSTIFPNRILSKGDIPLLILSLMTSLAIVFKNGKVLKTIGDWMHSSGVDSQAVHFIASDIIKDLKTDENPDKYVHLPHTAFLFTSIILIAIGKTYNKQAPPERLITQVTSWIEACPLVCFVPPHSAVFEIFRWVVNSDSDQSRLHLAVLNSITRAGARTQLQTIPHLLPLIGELHSKFTNMNASNLSNPEVIEKSTERLLQLIQVLIGAEFLDRNEIYPIFDALEQAKFPPTRLYEILKGIYIKPNHEMY